MRNNSAALGGGALFHPCEEPTAAAAEIFASAIMSSNGTDSVRRASKGALLFGSNSARSIQLSFVCLFSPSLPCDVDSVGRYGANMATSPKIFEMAANYSRTRYVHVFCRHVFDVGKHKRNSQILSWELSSAPLFSRFAWPITMLLRLYVCCCHFLFFLE